MVNQALAETKHSETQIDAYARRGEIREAMERFKAGLALKDATEHEYAALAHISLKYNIDPFNGEAWIIPHHGIMVGIKGLRKMANRQARDGGFTWWTEFMDIRNAKEAEQYGVPEGAEFAKMCKLRRSDQVDAWTRTMTSIAGALGAATEYEVIKEAIGAPPVIVGVGYVMPGERSKMPKGQLCMKRAEAHAIKQAFDVDALTAGDVQNGGRYYDEPEPEPLKLDDPGRTLYGDPDFEGFGDVVPGEVVEKKAPEAAATPPTRAAAQKQAPASGDTPETPQNDARGTPLKRPYDAVTFKRGYRSRVDRSDVDFPTPTDKQVQYLASLMGKAFEGSPTERKDRMVTLGWLLDRELGSTKDATGAEASVLIDILTDDSGELGQEAHQELNNCLRAAMLAQGQADMFEEPAA